MKRLLLLLVLAAGLTACGVSRSGGTVSVEAEVLCAFYNGDAYASPAPVLYGPYSRVGISESEAVRIFNAMTTAPQRAGISTATLHLRYLDSVSGSVLAEEDWGILWDSTRRRFLAAPLTY